MITRHSATCEFFSNTPKEASIYHCITNNKWDFFFYNVEVALRRNRKNKYRIGAKKKKNTKQNLFFNNHLDQQSFSRNCCKLKAKNARVEWTMQKIGFKAQCVTANKDKRGQNSPGPPVTHSQGDMAHYDSPFAVGPNWKGEGGVGDGTGCAGWGGVGWLRYQEERQLRPNGGEKGQLVS